ncbi:MAG: hypothetical protein WA783_05885 [Phormidesmis sp.]
MASPSELESRSRLILGLGLLSLGLVWLLKLLWPVLILFGMSLGGYWLWRQQHRKYRAYQRRQNRLSEKFCHLLQQRQGRVSALEFAMHTRLNSRESQRYLHSQAQAFNAFFERTVHGDIVYIFDLAVVFSLAPALAPPAYAPLRQQPATPAEIAWAYAEQSRKTRPKLTARSAHRQNTAPVDSEALPTVRGRAANTHKGIVTIDVAAVNE